MRPTSPKDHLADYNSVSEYIDHQRQHRGKTTEDRREGRMEHVLFGAGHDLKAQAYDSALAMAR